MEPCAAMYWKSGICAIFWLLYIFAVANLWFICAEGEILIRQRNYTLVTLTAKHSLLSFQLNSFIAATEWITFGGFRKNNFVLSHTSIYSAVFPFFRDTPPHRELLRRASIIHAQRVWQIHRRNEYTQEWQGRYTCRKTLICKINWSWTLEDTLPNNV